MIKIVKTFETQGTIIGCDDTSLAIRMKCASFILSTQPEVKGTPENINAGRRHLHPVLRIVVPVTHATRPLLIKLRLCDEVKVKGIVCIESDNTVNGGEFFYYCTDIERIHCP